MSERAHSDDEATGGLYAIFVHRGLKPQDVDRSESQNTTVETLVDELKYLSDILDEEGGWSGVAFVFLDYGWVDLLRDTAQTTDVQASEFHERIRKARQAANNIADIRARVEAKLNKETGDRSRVRLIVANDMDQFVGVLRQHAEKDGQANRLWDFLAGGQDKLLYDAPKVIESVIRLANSRYAVPVFRFDDDVIFFGARRQKGADRAAAALQSRANILLLCSHFVGQRSRTDVREIMFSGNYLEPGLTTDWWHNADECVNSFALRPVQLAQVSTAERDVRASREANKVADSEAILKEVKVTLIPDQVKEFFEGMPPYGADPFWQPISGAGEFFSYGLILDLPPYANMRQLVMWIDDYLKLLLHQALGHLPNVQPADIRKRNAWFSQFRHEAAKLSLSNVKWYLSNYMPRVVLGCIVDAWLRPVEGLSKDDQYVTYLVKGAKRPLGAQEQTKLRGALWAQGIKRANELATYFGCFRDTFLSLFVNGADGVWSEPGYEILGDFAPAGLTATLSDIGKMPEKIPAPAPELAFADALRLLIEDFVEYIEFVRFWKHFVYAVRWEIRHDESSAARFLIPEDVVKAVTFPTPPPISRDEAQWVALLDDKDVVREIMDTLAIRRKDYLVRTSTVKNYILELVNGVLDRKNELDSKAKKDRIRKVKLLLNTYFPTEKDETASSI